MNVTFLVSINLDSLESLSDVASDIEDKLSSEYEVKSVAPWARPTTSTPLANPLSVLPPLTETK